MQASGVPPGRASAEAKEDPADEWSLSKAPKIGDENGAVMQVNGMMGVEFLGAASMKQISIALACIHCKRLGSQA